MTSIRSTTADVVKFLRKHSVPEVIIKQFQLHAIDGLSFSLLTEQDLREMRVLSISQRKHLLLLSASWRRSVDRKNNDLCHTVLDLINDTSYDSIWRRDSECFFSNSIFSPRFRWGEHTIPCGDSNALLSALDDCNSEGSSISNFESSQQLWKVFLSAFYAFLVGGIASFIMVVAHERLPDISTYPPLPDLLLDNLPHITWAFKAAEWVGVVLMVIWIAIVFFHQYRWILLRRFFALLGTVFLLRSITMLITSLSVPGRHLAEHCTPYQFANQTARFRRVLDIWFGLGMSIRNIHTCGDYMFSGHTTVLTLLNFFITEYAPRKFQLLHTFSWILNAFGVFFIIASHEHYSIDVFVAIYVSSRLFLYYHCLANNRILHQEDKTRAMIWFPLFSLLEYDVDGIVPNIYEIPFFSHRPPQSARVQTNGHLPTSSSPVSTDSEHLFSLDSDYPVLNDKFEHKKDL